MDAATLAADTAADTLPPDFGETDFHGAFNGAKLWATLEAKGSVVSGSLFYDTVGVDLTVRGALHPDGTMTLDELDGSRPVSHTTLTRSADGTWTGTWSGTGKNGAATLLPLSRHAGEPVTIAARRVRRSSVELCGKTVPSKVPCTADARVPVVLGLDDRAFEKRLDDELARLATMSPPDNDVGLRVHVDYAVPLNAHGIVSFTIDGRYDGEPACDRDGATCTGVSAFTFVANTTAGLTANVDLHGVTSKLGDFLDVHRARPKLRTVAEMGSAECVASGDVDTITDSLSEGVLGLKGVLVRYDHCTNHVHDWEWFELPYAKLPLHPDSIYAAAWQSVTKAPNATGMKLAPP